MERVLINRCKNESKKEVENETNYVGELKKIKECKKSSTNLPLVKINYFHQNNLLSVATNKNRNVNLGKIKGNFAVECLPEYKPIVLFKLLTRNNTISKTLVYTNSEHTAHKLALFMQLLLKRINVTVGELSMKQHKSILSKFASAEIQV
ncbi:uncharacterized protein LOC114937987 [Nylanderia fulva]|uniref:uncharacterized protein LOC114937987 n=1 Tax=Nylanderia fulva TaxID=613905 RepID=UPI0010FB8D13|nr:uncharacterized protein LOC114937987 [Nylanderia fulva]